MNQQVEASVGTPVLDIELVKYPNLKWFPGLQYKGNKKDFIEALYQGPQPVSDTDDDDYEDQLFIAESSEDEDEDEDEERLALEADSDMSDAGSAMDVDEPAMDVDEPDNSTMLSYLETMQLSGERHSQLIPTGGSFFAFFGKRKLRYAFFPGPNDTMIDGEDAFQRAVLVLRQMRMVHTQSSAWVDEVKVEDLRDLTIAV
ncbi:hypothetical protein B0H14DRAFT_3449409 [Mycena olivaceomarginata]|nr:hypothetical protein B0H14DRAFT_3449409 [Mycena olivaceomarginata]